MTTDKQGDDWNDPGGSWYCLRVVKRQYAYISLTH